MRASCAIVLHRTLPDFDPPRYRHLPDPRVDDCLAGHPRFDRQRGGDDRWGLATIRKKLCGRPIHRPVERGITIDLSERISGHQDRQTTTSEATGCVRVHSLSVGTLERANTVVNFLPIFVRGLFEFLSFCALAAIFVLTHSWAKSVLVFLRGTSSLSLAYSCDYFRASRQCKVTPGFLLGSRLFACYGRDR